MLQVFVLGIVAMSAGAVATWLIAVSLSESAVASSANAGRFAGCWASAAKRQVSSDGTRAPVLQIACVR